MNPYSLTYARTQLNRIRKGRRVVLTAGTFDIIHPGHVDYLQWCRKHGDLLVVCVVGDKRTRRRKKAGRPIVKQAWRATMVASLKPVDVVFVSDRLPFEDPIIRAIRPDVIVTPSDEPSVDKKAAFSAYFSARYPDIPLIMRPRHSFSRRHSSTRRIVATIVTAFGGAAKRRV
jgi:cytidyltransferase-like protein